MSFTAEPVITDALNVSGFVAFGEAPEAEATALAVRLGNDILREWSLKSIYNPGLYSVDMPSNGTNTYLLGPATGTTPDAPINPAAISKITLKSGTVTYPVTLRSMVDWERVMPKNISGVTTTAFWDYQFGQSKLNVWPIPPAGYTLNVTGIPLIGTFENEQSQVPLPEEYIEFFKWTLAISLIPFMPPDVNANPKVFEYIERRMNTAGSTIKRRNSKLRTNAFSGDMPGVGGQNLNDGYLAWQGRAL